MFESLENAKIIALDIETYDPAIKKGLGSGELRGGYIAGIALATDDGYSQYYPIAHECSDNVQMDLVLDYLRKELGRASQIKIGANIRYDLTYLKKYGVDVFGRCFDVMTAEALLDENAKSFSLNTLAKKYLNKSKDDELLYQYLANQFGGNPLRKEQAHLIHRAPAFIVEDYAKSDALLPIEIYLKQRLLLQQQELIDVFNLETDLTPILIAMKLRGVRIDSVAVAKYRVSIAAAMGLLDQSIKADIGDININSAKQLSEYFSSQGIDGVKTKTGLLKTDKTALNAFVHPAAKDILRLKELRKLDQTYLKGYFGEHLINGRLHAQYDSVCNGHGGTVTGRFSSSKPNLQNIPKDADIRQFFLPEEGERWYSDDWSQIEYRLLVHYARGEGAGSARKAYNSDANTDYHEYTHRLIEKETGLNLDRKKVKGINFGLIYGMGKDKLAAMLELPLEKAIEVRDKYHAALPYVKHTMQLASRQARINGFIKTILGRRRHFDLYVPSEFSPGAKPLPYESAVDEYDIVTRADTHKALNAVLQGSCADIMKAAMVKMWESGICDVLGAPLSTIHDELNWSVPQTAAGLEAHKEAVHIMNNTIKLHVPLLTTSENGKTWGDCE